MKGSDLKAFRKANGLTQEALGDYLGIKKSFISTIESGKDPMPKDKLTKLLNNPYNWDVSMLTQPENPMTDEPKADGLVDYLTRKVSDQEILIRELYQEIGMLKKELDLAGKRETARGADGSFVANAV